MSQRVISADDHIDVTHDQVKAHLSPRFHEDYDAAVTSFTRAMASRRTAESNNRWREQQGLAPETGATPCPTGAPIPPMDAAATRIRSSACRTWTPTG